MTYVITQSCCSDATCVEVCPVDCIHPRPQDRGSTSTEMLHIDPRACVDCGACLDVCPAGAVVADHEMSAQDAVYLQMARDYFADFLPLTKVSKPDYPVFASNRGSPLRVAIIGTGPAGCYAAQELLGTKGLDVRISMFDRSPAFGGLIRHGVAPDHPRTKQVGEYFERNLPEHLVDMFLNVAIGQHLSHSEVLGAHHAVIYATGAAEGRQLDVPGQELRGSCTAADFVGWYNGNVVQSGLHFDLSAARAVVIGNGNVAVDVARILAMPVEDLAPTDIAEHARIALAQSRIKEIIIVGRGGRIETAATTPELIGLSTMPGVDVLVDGDPDFDQAAGHSLAARKGALLSELAARVPRTGRRIIFKYHRAPLALLGSSHVESISLRINDAACGNRTEQISCGLVVAAIGHRGTRLPGLPFDDAKGIIPNVSGRVIGVDGAYVTGWAKRGPSGVIGTNRRCAAETVANLLEDVRDGSLAAPPIDVNTFKALILRRQPGAVDRRGWQAIDRAERNGARGSARGRVKLVDLPSLLAAAQDLPVA